MGIVISTWYNHHADTTVTYLHYQAVVDGRYQDVWHRRYERRGRSESTSGELMRLARLLEELCSGATD